LAYTSFCYSQELDYTSYLKEIAFSSEYDYDTSSYKWNNNIIIYVEDYFNDPQYRKDIDLDICQLEYELTNIVSELNCLISNFDIYITKNKDSSNFRIYLGSDKWYNSEVYLSKNKTVVDLGLFLVHVKNNTIYKGTMYVDIYRTKNIDEKKHLLREELTQSLGFFNDSWRYPESIFFQGWTKTTSYSEIDKKIISMFYSK